MTAPRAHPFGGFPRGLATGGLALGVGALLCGCVHVPSLASLAPDQVDPRSPIAAEVRAAEDAPGPYPHLSKLPVVPTDVRPASAWREAVMTERAEGAAADRAAAAAPFTLTNSTAWAAKTRARVRPDQAHGAPADATDQAQAFADALRARATPPPSPK